MLPAPRAHFEQHAILTCNRGQAHPVYFIILTMAPLQYPSISHGSEPAFTITGLWIWFILFGYNYCN